MSQIQTAVSGSCGTVPKFPQGYPEGRTTVSAELYGYTVLGYNTTAQRVLRQLRKK